MDRFTETGVLYNTLKTPTKIKESSSQINHLLMGKIMINQAYRFLVIKSEYQAIKVLFGILETDNDF
jgi:hypothetical protein